MMDKTILARAEAFDPARKAKFLDLPVIIADWLGPYGGLAGRRVLDFGCGHGDMAAGIAMTQNAALVVGIDIEPTPLAGAEQLIGTLGLAALPPNLRLERVAEGELGSLEEADVIVSWSAIEHVGRAHLNGILSDLRHKLVPGGLMMLQVSPLYFSPEGGHLWACGYGPWEHLEKEASQVLSDISACAVYNEKQRDAVRRMFLELNRLTAPELIETVERAGFRIVRQQIDRTGLEPPPVLLTAYAADALTTEQIVLLLQKD